MLDKLKGIAEAGKNAVQMTLAPPLLVKYFQGIGRITPESAQQLTRYVLAGDGYADVPQVSPVGQNTTIGYSLSGYSHDTGEQISSILDLLPQNTKLYCRLALAMEAATNANSIRYPMPSTAQPKHRWMAVFLGAVAGAHTGKLAYFPAQLLESMMREHGDDPSVLVQAAFITQSPGPLSRYVDPLRAFRCLSGFGDTISQYPEIVRQSFEQREAHSRALVLQGLREFKVPVEPFLDNIATLAVSGSKEVREAAEPLLRASFGAFSPLLRKRAEAGSADERFQAVRWLAKLGGDDVRAFLQERLALEKAAKIVEQLNEAVQAAAAKPQDPAARQFVLTPVAEVSPRAPLPASVLDELRACLDQYAAEADAEFQAFKAQHPKFNQPAPTVHAGAAAEMYKRLQDFVIKQDEGWQYFGNHGWGKCFTKVQEFAAHPSFELIHLVRWCLLLMGRDLKQRNASQWESWILGQYSWFTPFLAYQRARKKPIDLRELATVFRAVGLDDRLIGERYLEVGRFGRTVPVLRSDPGAIWPYFAEREDLLRWAMGMEPRMKVFQNTFYIGYFDERTRRENAFDLLPMFPQPPASLTGLLWETALSSSKIEGPAAQRCLARYSGKEEKILAALTSRQQDARIAAASWLADLGYKQAIPALRSAFTKEKSESVKDEIIWALERLGVELTELLDVQVLEKEAEKGLAKGTPADLAWLNLGRLPMLRWAANAQPVSARIVQWFVLQSYKLGNPEPGPLLRRYCALFDASDRRALGEFVIESWIAHDTKPKHTPEQAAALAAAQAKQAAASAKQFPQYYPDFDEQRYQQNIYNHLLIQPEGSATSSKGILAIAGACCAGNVAATVHRYVKLWYGYRPSQCKALLQMLAWVDDPSAVQVVLAIANRFRTKSIQEEAMRQCQLLSERKGWTLDQLADRTIPTVGLDERGRMALDYGSREFEVSLSEELAFVITSPSGKVISSLPDPNQTDDAVLAKQAKANLSAARKELKTVLTMQKDRLYEALCTQRSWRFEELQTYLLQHPIVGRHCQRLIWVLCEGEKVTGSFRPLPDGSLTDFNDEPVTPAPDCTVRLGHDLNLPETDAKSWVQHVSDYAVEPLFQQFGKIAFRLDKERKEQTEITEFEGHILKAFSLRNRLTRLGYTRGQAQDGGWFFDYHKTFSRLGIEAIIEFSGNGMPEQNTTVALHRLYFQRKQGSGDAVFEQELNLGELPSVLLSECWNDIRIAAAEGTGYAADWQCQVGG